LVTVWISSCATPNLSPNSSAVSQLWKWGDFLSLSWSISLFSACSCSGRALEQEEHVIDVEAVRDRAAIVLGVSPPGACCEQAAPSGYHQSTA
jgi:hypothetical protein